MLAVREQRKLQKAAFCEEGVGENHALYAHLTCRDAECFRNGLAHKFHCLKACQISKVWAASHEIANKLHMSSNYENTAKTMTTGLTTNCDAETSTSDVEKNQESS